MAIIPAGGEGVGFQLFVQATDGQEGIYTNAAARDVYFGANPTELARLDGNQFLVIKLLDDGSLNVAYQQRQSSAWVDVTSLVQGETGPAGATGNSYFFESDAVRDAFFNTGSNSTLLQNGLPVIVNDGDNVVTSEVWNGVNAPITYDNTQWRHASLQSAAGDLFLGKGGQSISAGNTVLGVKDPDGSTRYIRGIKYDDTGSVAPAFWDLAAVSAKPVADVFDTMLSDPQEMILTSTDDQMFVSFEIRPASSGEFRLVFFLGAVDTGPVLLDTTFTVEVGDVGTLKVFEFENDVFVENGQQFLTRLSGIQVFGGLQTSGPFIGLTTPFLTANVQVGTSFDISFQLEQFHRLKAEAADGSATFSMRDFSDVTGWNIGLADVTAGDPIITEEWPFDKTILFKSGATMQLSGTDGHYNHAFDASGEVSHSISKLTTPSDLHYEVFGLGDHAAANSEHILLGWDTAENAYHLHTGAMGTGVKRDLNIDTGKCKFEDTGVDTVFESVDILASDTVGWSNPAKVIVHGSTVFGFGSGGSVTAHDIADINNIKLLNTMSDPTNLEIQSYAESPVDSTQTRVFSVNSNLLKGDSVTISAGGAPYNGVKEVMRVDSHGDFFDIDVVFSTQPSSSDLTATDYYGDYSAVRMVGNHIHAVDNEDNYYIYRIEGEKLIMRGRIVNSVSMTVSRDVVINGNYAYWISADSGSTIGFAVVDISDLENPVIANTVDNTDRFFKAVIKDNYMYVTSASGAFVIKSYSLDDPALPTLQDTSTPSRGANISAIEIKGNVAYVAAFNDNLLVSIDISDPAAMVELGTLPITTSPKDLVQFGDFIVVTDGADPGVNFIDVSDPSAMVLTSTLSTATSPTSTGVGTPVIVGDRLYIPTTNSAAFRAYSLRGFNVHAATIEDIESEKITVNRELITSSLNVTGATTLGGPVNILTGGAVDGMPLKGTPTNIVYFTRESDLPTPVGGVITLAANTTYTMYNDSPATSPQKTVDISHRIQIPDAGGVRITSVGLATAILNYSGSDSFLTTSANFTGFLHIDELFLSCPTGTLFDIDGVLPIGSEFFPRIFMSGMGVFNTLNLGTIKTISVNFNVGAFFSCQQGLTLDGIDEALIGDWRFANWQNAAGAVMLTAKNILRFPKIQNCTFETAANETAFDIRPNIGNETFIISGSSYRGDGTLYKGGTNAAISAVADATLSSSIVSVEGTAFGESIFVSDVPHGLANGELVTLSAFSETQYNTSLPVLEVIDSVRFRVHVAFSATDTGSWISNRIRVSAVNSFSSGDGVKIVNTGFYDNRYTVLQATGTTFDVNAGFVSTQTGSYFTDSLTELDPIMRIVANAGIPDSRVVCAVSANNTAMDDTTINTINVFEGVNLQAASAGQANPVEGIERFELVSIASGEVRYIGLEEFRGTMTVNLSVQAASGSPSYEFRILKNASDHVGDIVQEAEAQSTAVSPITVTTPVTAVNGDVFRVQVANTSGTQNIQVRHFTLTAS